MSKKENKMWGGRFTMGQDSVLESINSSIDFDRRLYSYDISGSRAHASMLCDQGIISSEDYKAIDDGLQTILSEIESGKFEFSRELEDIHMNIESRLQSLVGPVAGKLHTARSRNDQVALDFRLFVMDSCRTSISQIKELMLVLLDKASDHTETLMPGFTHLQCAQPIVFGHHCLAYVEMLGRDLSRFTDALSRMDECPLGSAALAGTGFPIDRDKVAKSLGFSTPTRNSLDTVSDRDFALEFLSCASVCAMHLSRLGEELVLWSTSQFNFITLPDSWSTGSSIMPQKRNADAAELVRAKVARINGAFITLSTVMKGVSLSYSKDMQEDKECVFDAADTLSLVLSAMSGMVSSMQVNVAEMEESASLGYSTATDLADWLVREANIPFREAHEITGKVVLSAQGKGCRLDELSLEYLQSVHSGFTESVFSVLSPMSSVASRDSYGGTAPSEVLRQLSYWKEKLK